MFDNPKKELERLEQQLLAAERSEPEADYSDVPYEQPAVDEVLDDALYAALYDDREFSRRSAGFDIPDEDYEMDTDRYVPAPKKRGIGGLVLIAILELILAFALIAWWLGWLS